MESAARRVWRSESHSIQLLQNTVHVGLSYSTWPSMCLISMSIMLMDEVGERRRREVISLALFVIID